MNLMVREDRAGMPYVCQILDYVMAGPDRNGVLHAVEAIDTLGWVRDRSRRKTWDTACGIRVPVTWGNGRATSLQTGEPVLAKTTIEWPPRVSSLPDGMARCKECHEVTGRRRPVTQFASQGSADDSR